MNGKPQSPPPLPVVTSIVLPDTPENASLTSSVTRRDRRNVAPGLRAGGDDTAVTWPMKTVEAFQ